mgnify:CR=1 FL=1
MASRANLALVVAYLAVLGLGVYELRRAPALSTPPAPPEQPAQALPPLEIPPDVVRSIAAYDAIIFHIDIWRSAVHNGHSKVVIKTEILWPGTQRFLPVVRSLFESEMPFPHDRRVVAAVFENISDRDLLGVDQKWRGNRRRSP